MTTNGTRSKRSALPAVFQVAPSDADTNQATSTGEVDRWRARLVFLSTALGAFLVTANVSTMNVAFPDLEQTFVDTSRGSLTWVLNAYTIAFAALLIPAGRLADRFGRRRVFMIGLAIFAVSSMLVGAAPNFSIVIVARLIQGVGGALLTPASLGLLLAVTPDSARMTTVAKWGSLTALGVATGPAVGSLIVDSYGWRWAFLLLPPFCLLAYLTGKTTLPGNAPNDEAPFPDIVGALLLATSMALLAFSIVQVGPWGWTSPGVVGTLLLSLVLLVLTFAKGLKHKAPAIPTHLFRIQSLNMANLATAIQSAGLSASILVNVLWLTQGWGYSIRTAGLATAPLPLFVACLAPFVGKLGTRYGVRVIAVPGSFSWGIGVLMYALFVTETPNYWGLWLPASLLVAIGVATTFPIISAAAVGEVPPEDFAVGGSLNQVGRQFGATIGVAALITVVGSGVDISAYHNAWFVTAATGPLAALAVFFIREPNSNK
ncbi:MAG: MFS transporter [Acidimicrobiaceae bacterium]|nr:MFS transporter [Acidimicrobiaceae bacterium]|tara:strand:+ start:1537 stop:3000 length:1464 start_codon:yes stop_codon:yes gene_type:complete